MAVSIVVTQNQIAPPYQEEFSVDFGDYDGYYWFLYPVFEELANETGQMVDIYGDAEFSGENLARFEEAILQARQLVEKQLPEWQVFVGEEITPSRGSRELWVAVTKEGFFSRLDKLIMLIGYAQRHDEFIVCLGD